MNTDNNSTNPLEDEEQDVLVLTGEDFPKLGQIEVTPAALALLEVQGLKPQYLLGFHYSIKGLAIDELDEAVGHPEVGPCMPVHALFETGYGPILVSTELQRDEQDRVVTRVMLPEPAPAKRPLLPTPPTPSAPAPE